MRCNVGQPLHRPTRCANAVPHCGMLQVTVHHASHWALPAPKPGLQALPEPHIKGPAWQVPTRSLAVCNAMPGRSNYMSASSSGTLVKIIFNCNTALGEMVKLVGSCTELGGWSPEQAPQLENASRNVWTVDIRLPPGRYEFKGLIINTVTRQGRWEEGDNHQLDVPAQSGVLHVSCSWGIPQLSTRLMSADGRPRPGTPRPSARASPTPYRSLSPSVARAATPSAFRSGATYRPTTPGPGRRVISTPSTLMRTPIMDGCTRLLVGNLPRTMRAEDVSRMFSPFGRVEDVSIVRDRYSGKPKGMATVVMESTAAKEACRTLHNQEIAGKPLVVEPLPEATAVQGRPVELRTVNGSRQGTPRPARTPLPGR